MGTRFDQHSFAPVPENNNFEILPSFLLVVTGRRPRRAEEDPFGADTKTTPCCVHARGNELNLVMPDGLLI
jgi:hypothetical protein